MAHLEPQTHTFPLNKKNHLVEHHTPRLPHSVSLGWADYSQVHSLGGWYKSENFEEVAHLVERHALALVNPDGVYEECVCVCVCVCVWERVSVCVCVCV